MVTEHAEGPGLPAATEVIPLPENDTRGRVVSVLDETTDEIQGPFEGVIEKVNVEHGYGFIRVKGLPKDLIFDIDNGKRGYSKGAIKGGDISRGDIVQIGSIGEIRESGPRRAINVTLTARPPIKVEKLVESRAACLERLAASKPATEKVVEDAVIEEDRVIDKAEALKYIVLAAELDNIDLADLTLTELKSDKNGAVIMMEAKAIDEKTGNYKLLTYQIKTVGDVGETTVQVSSWDKDEDIPHSGDTLARYRGGKWQLMDDSKPKGEKWVESR